MKELCAVKYKGVSIKGVQGDLTRINADAIVNPANSYMVMGGGVAGAIKRRGGVIIEREARKHAPVPVGEAVVTTAGNLPAKYVIHAPTMEKPAMRIPPENVYKATKAALTKCLELSINKIAIPGMGTGVGGVAPETAGKEMAKAIKDVLDTAPGVFKEIIIIDLNPDIPIYVCKALREMLNDTS